jgi:hypothetical protein
MSTDTDRIRALNDELRQHLRGGRAVMTPGVAALGQEAVQRLVRTIALFDDFCTANDPHGEHDFGAFEFDGTPVMLKIDYFEGPQPPLVRSRGSRCNGAGHHPHASRGILGPKIAQRGDLRPTNPNNPTPLTS